MKFKNILSVVLVVLMAGCAGMQRGCNSFIATNVGSDWVVVQYDMNMVPKCAWILHNTSITNEGYSDGIYWLDKETTHLVHISGWYNRVQVTGGRYEEAAKLVGVEVDLIQNGKYPKGQ